MTADFRALCVELTDCLEKADWPLRHRYVFRQWIDIARAALAGEPAVPEVVGSEWQPCVKLPITVHVREQRPGEQHVSTREGITPVQPDDLIMLGVDGEEYPIGRELFQRTYRMGSADEPAVPEGREPAAVTKQPSDAEQVLRLAAIIREVDGNHSKGAAALAESIFNHPDFRAALADEPAVPQSREPASVTKQPSDQELLDIAASTIEPYECSGITTDEYGPETECAVEAYGSELIAFARAVLARWGRPAPAPPADGEVAEVVEWLHTVVAAYKSCRNTDHIWSLSGNGVNARLTVTLLTRAAELLERHAAPVPKLALAPANDYKSRWLEEDGVMKPVINWIHTIPIEDKDIFHCAQSSCWCSPKVDKDNPEIILHQALTSAQDGWVLIGEIEAASEKPDSLASPPPSELIAELIPELRKVAEHLRDCNFRGFSNYVARAAELLGRQVPPEVGE